MLLHQWRRSFTGRHDAARDGGRAHSRSVTLRRPALDLLRPTTDCRRSRPGLHASEKGGAAMSLQSAGGIVACALALAGCQGATTTGPEPAPAGWTASVTLAPIPGATRSVSRGFREGDAGTVTVDATLYDPISGTATFHVTPASMDFEHHGRRVRAVSQRVSGCDSRRALLRRRVIAGRGVESAEWRRATASLLQRDERHGAVRLLAARLRPPAVDPRRANPQRHPRTGARD